MLRNVASKVAWVGRTASVVFGLALVLALVVGLASTALSATGGNFILGQPNSADAPTTLTWTGNTDITKSALVLRNFKGGNALQLQVGDGIAPLKVNSDAKVANLNADKLDNLNPSQIKGAKAFAVVDPKGGDTPVFFTQRTSGFTTVERIAPGSYCLHAQGLNSANRPAVVSVDWLKTNGPEATASAMVDTSGCDDGDFNVKTERVVLSGSALDDIPSNTVGFVIVVP